jgi:DNA-nicking Smr family endonuclease
MKRSLDLHGFTIHAAWREFNRYVTDAYFAGVRSVVVVTGHGQIGDEIVAWSHNHERVRGCERMNPNTGAYRIHLVKLPKPAVTENPTTQVDLYRLLKKFS